MNSDLLLSRARELSLQTGYRKKWLRRLRKDAVDREIFPLVKVVRAAGGSRESQAVAYLHDIFGRTPLTPASLESRGIPEEVCTAVCCLTRLPDETTEEFMSHIEVNPLAKLVMECQNRVMENRSHNGQVHPNSNYNMAAGHA